MDVLGFMTPAFFKAHSKSLYNWLDLFPASEIGKWMISFLGEKGWDKCHTAIISGWLVSSYLPLITSPTISMNREEGRVNKKNF